MRVIKFYNIHLNILPLISVIICTLILLKLGFWQVDRLKQKQIFINTISSNLKLEARLLRGELIQPYDKIKLQGHYLKDKDIYLYGQRFMTNKNQGGYYLLTPYETTDGKIYLVARNWFKQENRHEIEHLTTTDNQIFELTAVVLKGEAKKSFIPDNDAAKNMWFSLTLNEISKYLNLNIDKYLYLVDANSQSDVSLEAIDLSAMTKAPNNHLEYALTWFSLAIILLIIYITHQFKKAQKI